MVRPFYQNDEDLYNEEVIMSKIAYSWRVNYSKLPLQYKFDFGLFRKNVMVAVVEIKRRNILLNQYPDIILSLSKLWAARQFSNNGIPSFFVVGFDDGIYWHKLEVSNGYIITEGGRKDRGDWQDVEAVIHIPTNLFKELIGDEKL